MTSMPDDLRPPAPGRPVSLGEPVTPASEFVVEYEDERYVFEAGSWGRFGRDDDACEIPVWEEIREDRLSRVAGEMWVADGCLWIRNLSHSHELGVFGETGTPVWLPARTPGARGRACSAPTPNATLSTPSVGDWVIRTRALAAPEGNEHPPVATARLGEVPERLLPVAAALCAPMLDGSVSPVTHDGVARRLGLTKRQARRAVERLCDHYSDFLGHRRPGPDAALPAHAYLARALVNRGLIDLARVRRSTDA